MTASISLTVSATYLELLLAAVDDEAERLLLRGLPNEALPSEGVTFTESETDRVRSLVLEADRARSLLPRAGADGVLIGRLGAVEATEELFNVLMR